MGLETAILGGAAVSTAGSIFGGNAAADAQADAAQAAADATLQATRETNELYSDMYQTELDLYEPLWQSGISNQATLDWLLGTGADPNTLSYDYPSLGGEDLTITTSNSGGGSSSSTATASPTGFVSGAAGLDLDAFGLGGSNSGLISDLEDAGYNVGGTSTGGGSGGTTYYVGDNSFATLEEAEAYVASQTPEAFTPTYDHSYKQYDEYFADLKNLDNFYASPDYEFRLDEGIDAMQTAGSAGGARLSGETLKAIGDYSSDLASSEWGNYWNRGVDEYYNYLNLLGGQAAGLDSAVAGAASAGDTYTSGVANSIMTGADATANAYLNEGAAKASGYENFANSLNAGVGNLSSYFMYDAMGMFG